MSEIAEFLSVAVAMADASAVEARFSWHAHQTVMYKEDGSSLTAADLRIEEIWREQIREKFPTHGILGEEYGSEEGSSAYTWVLDPIDGTRQFGAGLLNITSLISVCRDGKPIIGIIDLPLANSRYLAAEGRGVGFSGRVVRTSGQQNLDAAVISLANPDSFSGTSAEAYERLRTHGKIRVFDGGSPAYGALARGLIDVCVNGDDLDAYDICALCPVVSEAGGIITDWQGGTLSIQSGGTIVASASPELHKSVLGLLSKDGSGPNG